MKCHYEVLGVERTADDKTIKNAYRKLALKFHPDKNLDNIDAAKEQFLLVQQAYDVLSDSHERAWYDNHREQILRGSHTDYEDESLDIYPYFTAACYKGFGDDASGFYAVYAKVFDQLASEDIEFMDTPDEYEEIPKFGTSTSDYETVVAHFYAYWQSYCTKKTYTWLCPHNISEIRDRRILREVEKETKKIAQKKRKERNDEVRALVSFVRKRDKRVQEYRKLLEVKAEQNRIKQQQHRLAQLRRNQQEAQEMQQTQSNLFSADHEEQLRQLEQAYGTDSDSEIEEIDDEDGGAASGNEDGGVPDEYYIDDLYCVACNKAFNNISSFENHELSKKHRENTERLKKHMQQEDEAYNNESQGVEDNKSELASDDEKNVGIEPSVEEEFGSKKKSNKKAKKSNKLKAEYKSDNENELEDLDKSLGFINIGNVSDDKEDWNCDGGKKKKKQKNKKSAKKPIQNEPESTSIENKTPIDAKKGLNKKTKKSVEQKSTDMTDVDHICVTCSSKFDSKNKLFAHLKKTNHGVYIPKTEDKVNRKK
ncbi:dnaJ homolog subfamily C member 21 [Sitodiplosis mosellana]|uniref:dnaJ homolog subfamily C member 21 n=1 Tax=Sitodiplosis mosellana TaxID=263140 RepID=UPI0024437B53|nr:dnaJ homolog subfamily C member 21 [Sitodiplosis mosellana]